MTSGRTTRWPLLLAALTLSSCWNPQFAREDQLEPPDRPGVKPPESTGQANPTVPDPGLDRLEDTDVHRTTLQDSASVYVRLGLPKSTLLADRAAVRLEFPVGRRGQPVGLAELAALAVSEAVDHAGSRPSLRRMITRLGGELGVQVGDRWTRFTAEVPASNWQTALTEMVAHIRRRQVLPDQFRQLQERLIRGRLEAWRVPALGYAIQWIEDEGDTRSAIVAGIQDRFAAETTVFQRRFYRPQQAAVGVWLPGVRDADAVTAGVREAIGTWQKDPPLPQPSGGNTTAGPPAPATPAGVRWIATPQATCSVALLVPLGDGSPESLVLLECFTVGGIAGRLGAAVTAALGREQVLQVQEIGGEGGHLALLTNLAPQAVPALWRAANSAWRSLVTDPPERGELARARQRVRLRLAGRQDLAGEWLSRAGRTADGGPIGDLHRLQQLTRIEASATQAGRELAMVVHGGTVPPALAGKAMEIELTAPTLQRDDPAAEDGAEGAARYLDLAVQAVGTRQLLGRLRGYELEERWTVGDGIDAEVTTRVTLPDEVRRVMTVLGSRVEIQVDGNGGKEGTGERTRTMTAGEAGEVRDEANRHPAAILSEWVRKKVSFRVLGTRQHNGREVAMLERIDPGKGRLRITVDTRSGLIRTVETIHRRPDLGPVRILESYGDYRRIAGIRVPTHRVTSVGGGAGPESVVTAFRPR